MSTLVERWAAHIRLLHPDFEESSVLRVASAAASTLQEPPFANKPPIALPLWARIGLAMGGKRMLAKMVGNKVTTTIGALIVLFEALCHGGILPPTWCAYEVAIVGLLTSLGLVAAKDGSTGSAPGDPPTKEQLAGEIARGGTPAVEEIAKAAEAGRIVDALAPKP